MADKRRKLAASIIDYLKDPSQNYTEEQQESIDVAIQCISDVFHVEGTTGGTNANLSSLFDVYLKTQERMSQQKGSGAAGSSSSSTSAKGSASTPPPPKAPDTKAGDVFKNKGNTLMAQKDYNGAIDAYTQAIEADASNVVYYSNRAAAYSQCSQFDEAIQDAKTALELDPGYSKAYSRLGHAYFSSGQFESAVEAYEKGLALDPGNGIMKSSLATARSKLPAEPSSERSPSAPAGGGGGGGGGFDMGSILSNPQFMSMAQTLMSSGALEGIMNNPQYAEMAQRFMGGSGAGGAGGGGSGGGMPDFGALMNDPNLRAM